MNERIRELYRQAHTVRSWDGDPMRDGNPPTVYWQGEVSAEKFAELIVQECLDTIQRGIDNGGGANEDIVMAGKLALWYSYRNIQYRFGMGDYKDKNISELNDV